LGEIERSRLIAIQSSLEDVSKLTKPFSLEIAGAGAFPGKNRPRVFWLGMSVEKESPLFGIQQWIEEAMAVLEFEKENRRFSPHLTLGRVKFNADFSGIFQYLEKHPFPSIAFTVDHVSLIQSHIKPSGAEYTMLSEYRF
ncbi:MAG: RNA 2',3'-cyclic phosphodiesterase, partial [Calditrichales bacterium]